MLEENARVDFSGFQGLKKSDQMTREINWGPHTHVVSETVLHVRGESGLKFGVFRRLTGALSRANPPARTTTNVGHYHLVNKDNDVVDTATRLIREKARYNVSRDDLHFVGVAGSALNRSLLTLVDSVPTLEILDSPAEPEIPFLALLFSVDVTEVEKLLPESSTLEEVGWFGIDQLIDGYTSKPTHIYSQFLFAILNKNFIRQGFIPRRPGIYT